MTESLEWELSSTLFYLTQTFLSMIHVSFYYRKLDMYMQFLTLLFSTRTIGDNKVRRRAIGVAQSPTNSRHFQTFKLV
nr:MAG TPA: hypothetical protein [Caudoviricetes sp.]